MTHSSLHPEASRLIALHGMTAHPEGGFFVEIFRSPLKVQTTDGRGERSAVTNILFLLDSSVNDGISRLHKVLSDEVWHFLDGAPLTLTTLDPDLERHEEQLLNRESPSMTVSASHWQAAQTTGPWTLVGCAVGPGFEFEDFSMLKDDSELTSKCLAVFPHLGSLV